MILNGLTLRDTKIVINSEYDLLTNCHFTECEIIASYPMSVYNALIRNQKREVKNLPINEESAKSTGCIFENCFMPDAYYRGCSIHSSEPMQDSGDTPT